MSAHHRHYCAADCGEWLTCSQVPDLCPSNWTCPTCEQNQRDEFFQGVAETEPEPHTLSLEMTGHEKH